MSPEGCPLGAQRCPLRHTTASPLNFQPSTSNPSGPRERDRQSTVRYPIHSYPSVILTTRNRCVSIGCEGYVRRATHVNSYTNIICVECLSAGGSRNMVIVHREMSASTSTPRSARQSALIISADSVNWVRIRGVLVALARFLTVR